MLLQQDVRFFRDRTVMWMDAWKKRDQEKLECLLSDNFIFLSTIRNKCLNRNDFLHVIMECFHLVAHDIDFLNISTHENTAIVVYRLSVRVKPNYTGEPEKYFVTDVWSLAGDQWKLVLHEPI